MLHQYNQGISIQRNFLHFTSVTAYSLPLIPKQEKKHTIYLSHAINSVFLLSVQTQIHDTEILNFIW